jgi:peptidyl-tRNA hydrolase, PTH1 family
LKLIIGLGNPGARYQFSRHNMGFLVIDELALHHRISMNQKGFDTFFGKGRIDDTPVFLAKPQTYMNLSGVAVRKLVDYFKADPQEMIVLHDDLDLPFPSIRIKAGGGHAGHKGLISIINHVGDSEFIRVRLGIGKPLRKSMTEEYVLKPFAEDELKELSQTIIAASDAVTEIITSGIQTAMNHYNERNPALINKEE